MLIYLTEDELWKAIHALETNRMDGVELRAVFGAKHGGGNRYNGELVSLSCQGFAGVSNSVARPRADCIGGLDCDGTCGRS